MSERNGDKARFGGDRKRKIHERLRIRELRKVLENSARSPALAALELGSITPLRSQPIGLLQ
jgi:hypothetical protein